MKIRKEKHMKNQLFKATWHKESYDHFINESLPGLILKYLPLEKYNVTSKSPYSCDIAMSFKAGGKIIRQNITGIPQPDDSGAFKIKNQIIVVVPHTDCEELDKAEIDCVGEQLYNFMAPRMNQGMHISDLKIKEWFNEFFDAILPWEIRKNGPLASVQPIDSSNWSAYHEHLRRIRINVPIGRQKIVTQGQLGRICPINTPEGPNLGRIWSIALGATIKNKKIVIVEDKPQYKLSMNASMIPLIEFDDCNRALMGSNMMRQWIPIKNAEPALVQTGLEPDIKEFWTGRNILTAFVSWGLGTTEDGIIISESCAKKLNFEGLIEPGDKISNRHGTKGVISQILPAKDMPHLQDGTPVELVWSFIGLATRLNTGQLREAILGKIAHAQKKPIISPAFNALSKKEVKALLKKNKYSEDGMEVLKNGKAGGKLDFPSTVGWVYWGITWHIVRNKLQVFTDKTSGELRGKGVNELSYLALKQAGAYTNIIDFFNTCSTESKQAKTLSQRISQGKIKSAAAPNPGFKRLKEKLRLAGIDMEFKKDKVFFKNFNSKANTLSLHIPVNHPWMNDKKLDKIVINNKSKEFQQIKQINQQIKSVINNKSPKKLVERFQQSMENKVEEYFISLLTVEMQYTMASMWIHQAPGLAPIAGEKTYPMGHISLQGEVLFSGQNVICPGNDLHIDQIGIPEKMAKELFKPFSKKQREKLWVIMDHWGTNPQIPMEAFKPVIVPDNAIQINPLI